MAFGILLRNPDSLSVGAFDYLLEDSAYSLVKTRGDLDWADAQVIEAGFGRRAPKAIVHFAPPDIERSSEKYLAEFSALIEVSAKRKIPLLHVSSYRVYGLAYPEKGWRESDPAEPDDELGKLYLAFEERLQELKRHIILRPSWLLEGSAGVLDQFLPPLLANKELVVSDHRYGSPISQRFIARVLFAMIQQILCGADNWGIFNVHSSDKCSEAEFADQLFRLLANEFKIQAKHPAVAGPLDERFLMPGCAHLLGRRCTANFGIQLPTWRSGFARVVKTWMDEAKATREVFEA